MSQETSQYHLYPCTNAEQMFLRVFHSQSTPSFFPTLKLDFRQSCFHNKAQFLFQNNALGEWFKVRLAQQQLLSVGLEIGHSQTVLEHYLRMFFPQMQQAQSLEQQENWIHPDIVSLLLFELLKNSSLAQLQYYLPHALQRTLQLLKSQSIETLDSHLWGFSQSIAALFVTYDQYREELESALEPSHSKAEEHVQTEELESIQAEIWQKNLWHNVQHWTAQGFYWHGQLIEEILQYKMQPQDAQGKRLEPEPLYIIGSGFLNPLHLAFYFYLSHFTTVHHFWLTPANFPQELCRKAASILWGTVQSSSIPETKRCRVQYKRKQYQAELQNLGQQMGGLPESLWLENSLHSAALLSRNNRVEWHNDDEHRIEQNRVPQAKTLLQGMQQHLRNSSGQSIDLVQAQRWDALLGDGSIQYFACSDRRREVETLKDQILATLDANPDWQLNDIAVLAPDINQYQAVIQNVFEVSGQDYRMNCNFIDLRKGLLTSGKGASAHSLYFSAFTMLLDFAQSRFRLDECLRFLESPCSHGAQLLRAKPSSFWRKILRHWQLSWGVNQGHRQGQGQKKQGQNEHAAEPHDSEESETAEWGTWQGAAQRFVRDYTENYRNMAMAASNEHTATGNTLSQYLAFNQEEAHLLAELLQLILRLHQRMELLRSKRQSISEWVTQLESLQEEFLLCRNDSHSSDENDRSTINTTLRNFLAIETSLQDNVVLSSSEAVAGTKAQTKAKAPNHRAGFTSAPIPKQQLRFPLAVIRSLLQQKLEQNFGFKGRYLTQGITCASLQPYRSVPFRMICVLGLNEKDFPHTSNLLRFDLCADLPQHLSHQAQENHIFAELLISAQQRLLLFYQNRDMVKGCNKNPSSSLHELAYFIAKAAACDEAKVWQKLLQEQALFPFDQRYFAANSYFTYSYSAWQQRQALQDSYRSQLAGAEIALPTNAEGLESYSLSRYFSPAAEMQATQQEDKAYLFDFSDFITVIQDAPSFFWQHYSGLKISSDPSSRQGLGNLPLFEQFAQDEELLLQSLEPAKQESWLSQLWAESDYLQYLLALPTKQRRDFLLREGLFGSAVLLRKEYWQSFEQGLQAMRYNVEMQLQSKAVWPGWQALADAQQFQLLLQWQAHAKPGNTEPTAHKLPKQWEQQSGRLLFSETGGPRIASYLLAAVPLPFEHGIAFLEGELKRLWFFQEQLFCWNRSPYRFPPKIYNLLQAKFFYEIQQARQAGGFASLLVVEKLLQLEWVYNSGLQLQVQSVPELGAMRPLSDYIWLVWRATYEPLPLRAEFLQKLNSEFRNMLTELVVQAEQPNARRRNIRQLQKLWQGEWLSYMREMEQSLRTGKEQSFGPALQVSEGQRMLGFCFRSETLEDLRFWQIIAELLETLTRP